MHEVRRRDGMEATNRLRAKQCAHLKITARAARAWWNNLWNICLVPVTAAAMSSENMSKLSHVEGLNHIYSGIVTYRARKSGL